MVYEALQLELAREADLGILMSWFRDPQSCQQWGGPDFRFPFSEQSVQADLNWAQHRSYVLKDHSNTLLGFGQFFQRAGRCHLARLAIEPSARGRGLGQQLVEALMAEGYRQFKLPEYSLFVYRHNQAALTCYQRLGFRAGCDPMQPDGCDFLVCSVHIPSV